MTQVQEYNARNMAGQNFKDGYNCAEAVLRTFRDKLNLDLPDEALKMASGFGGGVGHAGCMCGALTGAVMVLGMLQGRSSSDQSRESIYLCANEFHQHFQQVFGATCCRVLNPHPFDTTEHLKNCLKITGRTAELLETFIDLRRLR